MSTNPKGSDVAKFDPPRLPWHEAIGERFNLTPAEWKVITEAIFPSAKTSDSVVMAIAYCQSRKLDVFKRPVHIVPIWDSKKNGYIETVWPGIGELRTTAMRTNAYAGIDKAEFGEMVTRTFEGKIKKKEWVEVSKEITFPEWVRITVYKMVQGTRVAFVGPEVYWLETYGSMGASDVPNDMWETRACGQLIKCGEAAALRRAFPEELGNEYAAEEMEGRKYQGPENAKVINPETERPTRESVKEEMEGESPQEADSATTGEDSGAVEQSEAETAYCLYDEYGQIQNDALSAEDWTLQIKKMIEGIALDAALKALVEHNESELTHIGQDHPVWQQATQVIIDERFDDLREEPAGE